jgi:hypothetical protein
MISAPAGAVDISFSRVLPVASSMLPNRLV